MYKKLSTILLFKRLVRQALLDKELYCEGKKIAKGALIIVGFFFLHIFIRSLAMLSLPRNPDTLVQ